VAVVAWRQGRSELHRRDAQDKTLAQARDEFASRQELKDARARGLLAVIVLGTLITALFWDRKH
jgi:hypothetical protein